jgi:hypothetical protein
MSIGKANLTDSPTSLQATLTAPGMAYFAGSGPAGKTCGDCKYWTYYRQKKKGRFSTRTGQEEYPTYRWAGCAKFRDLTGQVGPQIDDRLHACKYFEQKHDGRQRR